MSEVPNGPGRDWRPYVRGNLLIGVHPANEAAPPGWTRLTWHTNPRAVWRTADGTPADRAVEVIGYSTGNLPLTAAPP